MKVVRTEAGDASSMQAARSLLREYEAELGVDLCFQGFAEELRDLPGPYAFPAGVLLLAWSNGEAAGCGAIKALEEGVCEMKRLYVRPAFRGQGLGDRIVGRLFDEAAALGYRKMRLDTLTRLRSATRLYERHGFRRTLPYCPNPLPDVLYLEKDLLPV